jgi:glyoxylase-like metal-dependent hydrolase (beta-lactamase superfamily II)
MALEDHSGDVLSKARQAANKTIDAMASVAGISSSQYAEWEKTGIAPDVLNWSELCRNLGLHEEKFKRIAQGWMPAPVDLNCWRELRKIETFEEGYGVNCYLIWDEITREAALFDTGWSVQMISSIIKENKLQLKHMFITHHHEDHVAGLSSLRQLAPRLRIHSSSKNVPPDQKNRTNDCISIGSLRITHRDAPGHAEDSVVYIVGGFPDGVPLAAVVGDNLFAGSIGRGFYSFDLLKRNVKERILSLPGDTLICPGHGPLTTVSEELNNNPFLLGS